MARKAKERRPSESSGGGGRLFLQVMIALFMAVLLVLSWVVAATVDEFFYMVVIIAMDIALIASLAGNFIQSLRLRKMREQPEKKEKQPEPKPAPTAAARRKAVDPKDLPDPGLVFRFDLNKDKSGSKRIVIGQTEGTIKTYSTEIINNHLQIDIRLRRDNDQDIYDESKKIEQQYQLDLRRGARAMIYYPGMERFREMDARERLVIQKEPDASGDFQFENLDPRMPIRFQLGDRLRHDGKFIKGFMEFHLFTKDQETEVAGYKRHEKLFFLRVYKIFPGYDTAHPTEDGMYPMIDPFITR